MPETMTNRRAASILQVSRPVSCVVMSVLLTFCLLLGPTTQTMNAASPGTVVAWGANSFGLTNVPVSAQSGVIAIAVGDYHAVALKSDGTVVAWGYNDNGQTNVPAAAQSGVVAVAAGFAHSVALKSDGSVLSWGSQTVVPVTAQSGVVAISAKNHNTAALRSDGSVVAWGENSFSVTNVPVAAQSGVTAIAAGPFFVVALKSDGSVVAWGSNSSGQTAVPMTAQSGVVAVAAGHEHSVALKSDGSVVAWGRNNYGQTNVPVSAQSGVTAIAAGIYFNLALKSDRSVVVWGDNTFGQTNVPPSAQSGVMTLAAGGHSAAALVAPPISVSTSPAGQAFTLGGAVLLSVTANGTGPLYYQWQVNGTNITGATNSTLALANLTATNAGAYRVVITNAFRSAISTAADVYFFGDLKLLAATVLAGSVGQQYRVDYADVVSVGTTNWLTLTNVTLPYSPFLVIDPNSAGRTQRYYRAVPLP